MPRINITPNKIIWAEYSRRSSDEKSNKQNVSIPRQRQELAKRFPKKEYKRSYHLSESKSAYKPDNRPEFNKLINLIEAGKVTGLIVFHPNRLSRNPTEAGKIVQLIADKKILDIKFATYTFDNSAEGILLLQFALSQSQYESTKLSDHVHSGNKYKFFENKEWGGPAKQGFINFTHPFTKKRDVKVDQKRFSLLQQAGKKIISGEMTVLESLNWLNNDMGYRTLPQRKQGDGPLSRSTYYRLLSDPFYYGVMSRKIEGVTQESEHKYPKMFTKDEWDIIQIRLGKKSRSIQKKYDFPYKGIMTCGECGGFITAEEKWQIICPKCSKKFAKTRKRDRCIKCGLKIELMKNPTILHYIYYHCTKKVNKNCSQGYLEIGKLEEQIDNELKKFEIDPDFKDWAINHISELNDKEVDQDQDATKRNTTNYEKLKSRLRRMTKHRFTDLYEESSEEEKEAYEAELSKLKKEIETVKNDMQTTDQRQYDWIEISKKTFEFACYARYWFAQGDVKTKTQILQMLGSNLKLHNKKVLINRDNPFWMIEKCKQEAKDLGISVEPGKLMDVEDKLTYLQPLIPSLLRD